MNPTAISKNAPGELVRLSLTVPDQDGRNDSVYGFVPNPLPPAVVYNDELVSNIGNAMYALGRLDKTASDLPNPAILVRPFLRREALLSSRIEGTRAELTDILLLEEQAAGKPGTNPDHQETANYFRALEYGLDWIDFRPITTSLIRDLHRMLFEHIDSDHIDPGVFRRGNVYLGGPSIRQAAFVPPPAEQVPVLINDLVGFMQQPGGIPPLVQIALVHYQFETIHPFSDGNGRVGRLLISLMLKQLGVMRNPGLDLSAHIYRHRDNYIDGLRRVSTNGEWSEWIGFLVGSLDAQAEDANRRAIALLDLKSRYLRLSGKPKGISHEHWEAFIDALFERQSTTARSTQGLLGVSFPSAQRVIATFEKAGVLKEMTDQSRDRVWLAVEVRSVLEGSMRSRPT